MKHFASSSFWAAYDSMPSRVRKTADKSYLLLKKDPKHASLNFKQIGRLWSVRTGIKYRALAVEVEDGLLWFWLGSHSDYDKLIKELS
ncbi:MAG TPA: hypothetical protein PLM07_05490 [Candidatus Rifleibacterium sp.]|nr:hypothetical protein [Candidatus Rifleibacterium sp.]HPT45335.1 hypothetical protein [Candidatus Rifleibacterium sp.]